MPTKFPLTSNININNDFGLIPSDTNYSATLMANTDTTVTVPSSSSLGGHNTTNLPNLMAVFYYKNTAGNTVWVAKNATAAVPAGSTFALTTSQANPVSWQVKAGDVLHFITAGTSIDVNVTFYWLS